MMCLSFFLIGIGLKSIKIFTLHVMILFFFFKKIEMNVIKRWENVAIALHWDMFMELHTKSVSLTLVGNYYYKMYLFFSFSLNIHIQHFSRKMSIFDLKKKTRRIMVAVAVAFYSDKKKDSERKTLCK